MSRRLSLVVLGLVLSGCLWRGYSAVLEVHLTVLLQMTDKLCGMGEIGHAPTVSDMVEFGYPAQRGREFLRAFRSSNERPSYRQFGEFLDRYEALLKRVDAARVSEASWRADVPQQQRDRAALAELAASIRRDLTR